VITGRTAFFAIVADPVAQARAPVLVNRALAGRGVDAVLVPLHVGRDGLAPLVHALRAVQNFAGGVFSMPHKTTLVSVLDDVTTEARQVGACNVVRREPDGRLVGTMYDGEGFVAGVRGAGHDVRGRRIFLAGAGGAAAAIAFALGKHGAAALTIHNRTAATAESLAARVRDAWPALRVSLGSNPRGHDVVVNATSLGMRPEDPLPVDVDGLGPGTLAAEVVISSAPTPFLAAAAARGATVHHGEPMLAAQIDLMLDFILR
jgi:shikimate dehydrogenase